MKTCPNCHAQMDDKVTFCSQCGAKMDGAASTANANPQQPQQKVPFVDPYDHTAEFQAKDIADNKLFALVAYVMGTLGIIMAMLVNRNSEYLMFHVKQAVKFTLVSVALGLVTAVLFWTVIIPILSGIALAGLLVIRIISIVQVCMGKAKEPFLIRNLKFLG